MAGIRSASAVLAAAALVGCATQAPKPPPVRTAAVPPAPGACADFSFPIYFDTGSAALSATGRQVVDDAAKRVRGCRILKVEVVGLADADGSARVNLAVSRRRAASVAAALAAGGLPQPSFDIEAAGQSGAVTPEGQPEPLRRRAEVVIRASPPAPTPPPPRR